jgi:hypothetical protein
MFNENFIRITGVPKNGIFVPFQPQLYKDILLKNDGRKIDLLIKDHEEPKSKQQLGFFFKVIIRDVCMQTELFGGWDKDEIYEFFCSEFLAKTKTLKLKSGKEKILQLNATLSACNKLETAIFIDNVIRFLANEGIEVPDPINYTTL